MWLEKIKGLKPGNSYIRVHLVKPDSKRILQHIPIGAFGGWLLAVHPPTGIVFNAGFLVYQLSQDWKLKGSISVKDIMGWLIGLGGFAGVWHSLAP